MPCMSICMGWSYKPPTQIFQSHKPNGWWILVMSARVPNDLDYSVVSFLFHFQVCEVGNVHIAKNLFLTFRCQKCQQ